MSPDHDVLPVARLRSVLRELTTSGTLQPAQADAVLARLDLRSPPPHDGRRLPEVLAEVGGYVGGIFLFAAALVVGSATWDRVSRLTQVVTLAAVAVLLITIALVVAWPLQRGLLAGARGRLVSTLVVLGAASLAGAVGTGTEVSRAEIPAFGAALLVTTVAYVLWRGPFLHVAVAFTLCCTVSAAGSLIDDPDWLIGLALLAVALAWALGTLTGLLAERALGYLVAGIIGFVGAEFWAAGNGVTLAAAGYLALAVIAVTALAAYTRTRRIVLVVVGVVTMGVLVPQAVIDYSGGAFGAAGALLVVGVTVVAVSLLGLRLHASQD